MDENVSENKEDITAEEKLKHLDETRKELKKQVLDERTIRLEEAAKDRVFRDEKIENLQIKLKKIQSAIYDYNKLGKVAKVELDILGIILKEINAGEDIVNESAGN